MKRIAVVVTLAMAFCFAIMALNPKNVLADAQHDLIEKKVKQTNRIVKGNASKLVDGRHSIKQKASTTFPIIIDQPGSYVLTSDISVSVTTVNCIEITADNVTLDLNGFSLIGPSSGSGNGIYMNGQVNVEIRNGTIQGFGSNGVREAGDDGKRHRMINIRVVSNGGHGISLNDLVPGLGNGGHLVKDCVASENGSSGIHGGTSWMITGSICSFNGGHGISVLCGRITGCRVVWNGENGISAIDSNPCIIRWNTIGRNQLSGINCKNCIITGNHVGRNNLLGLPDGAGISVQDGCLVEGNRVKNSDPNNIYVSGTGNAIEENLVTNSPNGIYFDPSTGTGNFYSNNRASGNTTDYNDPGGNTDGGGNVSF